ncbi:unnamed protein product [Rotaria sp. Silwood2]|nr:unnamed protein product [Rotaria sp. Silwood2]CAF2955592.1 unnamed protein product [Rotaria sp. Silwood2]CAF3099638.1 unnamed protein product [Rotaria sp. Silwood2]CAF3315395.1 unnamed protein product [Rotaria sp. Silwood2]CAF4303031.1 unnamed protein product [Rotaria sp. Silwood2]
MSSSILVTTLASVQRELIRYCCSIWLTFGVPGCLLNVILLSRRQLRVTSCCNYFLGASSTLIITISVSSCAYLYSLNHPDPITIIRAFCKARLYVLQTTMMMGRWMITMACVDRYALSSRNASIRKFAQVHVARRVIPIIVVVWLILPIHTLVFYEIREAAGICAIVNNWTAALYHSI